VVNHQEAIEFVESLIKPNYVLNADDILSVHSVVLNKIEKDFAGRIRNGGVRIMGANFTPPNAAKVYDLLNELIEWVQYEGKMLHPVVMASIFHHRFVWIHPFFDGNGRTVRLLFNLLLMKEGYPPAIILKNDRKKYYDALNRANKGDYNKIILLVMQAMERSLDIYLSNLDDEANDYQAISTIVNDSNVPYGQEYVSLLARRGEIDAFKEGNVWFTSKKALVEYISSRKRKRHLE
jgi:Fic family protein